MEKNIFALALLHSALLHSSLAQVCDFFSASGCGATNNALKNYASCSFNACGGDYVQIDTFYCFSDPFIRLHSSDGSLLALNDDYDGTTACPFLDFTVPEGYECATYDARLGCSRNVSDCEGELSITITGMHPYTEINMWHFEGCFKL
jgi:hypothetical protein